MFLTEPFRLKFIKIKCLLVEVTKLSFQIMQFTSHKEIKFCVSRLITTLNFSTFITRLPATRRALARGVSCSYESHRNKLYGTLLHLQHVVFWKKLCKSGESIWTNLAFPTKCHMPFLTTKHRGSLLYIRVLSLCGFYTLLFHRHTRKVFLAITYASVEIILIKVYDSIAALEKRRLVFF
jgi:hypothetical protein